MESEVKNVLATGDLHKKAHWKVYFGTNIRAQQVYCSSAAVMAPDASVTWESTRSILESYLRLAPPGRYTIHFKESADDKLGFLQTVFDITADNPAINGTQGNANQNMPLQFMYDLMSKNMTAEIGKISEQFSAKLEKIEMQKRLDELEKKLKEKKEKSAPFEWSKIPEIIDSAVLGYMKVKELKNGVAPAIAISGANEKNIPADAANKKEPSAVPEMSDEDKKLMSEADTLSDELVELNNETMFDLAKMFGGFEKGIKELHCLKEFLKVNTALYNSMIVPQLKPYKDALNERLEHIPGK